MLKLNLLLALFLTFSCSSIYKNDELELPIPTNEIKTLKGKVVFSNIFLGRPHRMLIVKNNLLISDGFEGKLMTLIDLNHPEKNQRIVHKGQGPNEFFRLSNVSYHEINNTICFYDGDTGYVKTYQVNDQQVEINRQSLVSSIRLNDHSVKYVLPFGEHYLSRGAFENKQLALFNKEGECLSTFGLYPGSNEGISSPEAFFLKTQGEIRVSPDQKHFVVAGWHHDQLTFYKNTDSIPLKVKEYFSEEPKVTTTTTTSGKTTSFSSSLEVDSRIIYYDIYPTNNKLYALYWGIKDSEMGGEIADKHCAVLVFDWDGSLKQAYKIPHLIKAIAIDEDNNCIYGLRVSDGDPQLMKYEL